MTDKKRKPYIGPRISQSFSLKEVELLGRACHQALQAEDLFQGPLVRLSSFSHGERHVLGQLENRLRKMQDKAEVRQHPAALSEKKDEEPE